MRKYNYLLMIAGLLLILSSCGTRKIYTDASANKNIKNYSGSLSQKYASLLGVSNSEVNNTRLYEFIDQWMGTPYKYAGSSRSGVDCSSFAGVLQREVYRNDLPRSSADQAGVVKSKNIQQLKEGDLVFFTFGGKNINHVGVYLKNGRFVHASTSRGVIISNLNDVWYRKVFAKAGSIR